MGPLDGTPWPALERLNLRWDERLLAGVGGTPMPVAVEPLPRVSDPQVLTLEGIGALRGARPMRWTT